jgi:hypothetical protein
MRAWKFFEPGARPRLGGAPWPLPVGRLPAGWTSEPRLRAGEPAFACRLKDLAYWMRRELWEVELEEPVVERSWRVEAPRARLILRIDGWDLQARRDFLAETVALVQERCAARLALLGHEEAARSLRACASLEALRACTAAAGVRGEQEELVGYARDAANAALNEGLLNLGLIAASAAEATRAPGGHEAERLRQSRWIAARLGLS